MVVIQIEKVPQAIIDAAEPEFAPRSCLGVTIITEPRGPPFRGFRKVIVYVKEKQSQYRTREIIAHELIHVLQYLTGCDIDETGAHQLENILVAVLKPKKKAD
jgi:hypothetical protein